MKMTKELADRINAGEEIIDEDGFMCGYGGWCQPVPAWAWEDISYWDDIPMVGDRFQARHNPERGAFEFALFDLDTGRAYWCGRYSWQILQARKGAYTPERLARARESEATMERIRLARARETKEPGKILANRRRLAAALKRQTKEKEENEEDR